ncbi:hypothetical protein B0T10DRAFT_15259 [Thelonectria olida]|uniref:Spore coat protein SP96 n=1 Tax=Thelonectria olida TaxID=1576542 RepID=A0A9P8WID3_9HYPO|nr:hypothetical protein B0T10DRAFT_15259 [Thelonectria olida]
MKFFQSIAVAFGLAGLAQAHMEMIFPAPFKSKANPYAGSDVDYSMTAPLDASGSNFPCKGYHSLFGTDAGKSTATFAAGSQYNMTITGGANHGGGSCQASLSFDKGSTWRVIHSYIGNCPTAGTSSYDFKIPSDTPSGDVIFAWTWFNQIGNREMYMNCAAVTITGGTSAKRDVSALSERPTIFVANVMGSSGCVTKESVDVTFPYPGQDVTNDSKTAKYVPDCGEGSPGSGSGDNSGDNNGSQSSAVVSSVVATSAAATTQPAATSAGESSVPGGVFITVSDPADGSSATSMPATSVAVTSAPADTSAPAATFSTLITVTKSAGSGNSATPSATTSEAQASPTSGSGDDNSGSGEAFTAGTSCDNEGEWNCVGTSQFQRCASGQWSVLMAVAAGTKCDSGKTSALSISAVGRSRRFFRRN